MNRPLTTVLSLGLILVACGGQATDGPTPSTTIPTSPSDVPSPSDSPSPIAHPDKWDDRVLDLVTFVENERRLDFLHPVAITFLADAEFSDHMATRTRDQVEKERDTIERDEALLRAFGLLGGADDLADTVVSSSSSEVLGYYDPDTREVVVRGDTLSAEVRGTLVHELTHALQDQHFGVDREFDDDRQQELFHVLVEGDAVRVESAWRTTLGQDELDEYTQLQEDSSNAPNLPPAFVALIQVPYALGQPLTEMIIELSGYHSLDALFRDVPTDTEQVYDPMVLLGNPPLAELEDPAVPSGAEVLESGPWSAIFWYVMLAARLGADGTVMQAVDGWAGDRYTTYELDERMCAAVVWAGDSPTDVNEMEAVLEAWVAAGPSGSATVTRDGSRLRLTSCDPGVEANAPDIDFEDLLIRPVARAWIGLSTVADGAPDEDAQCFARQVAIRLSIEDLVAEEPSQAGFQEIVEIVRECAS